jgi:6-pyruvoyltetrahydropterin/6-carboxytetrahydropterin synthase
LDTVTTTITREFAFDMGHMLPDHLGGCYRPHGHRYRCQVTCTGPVHDSGAERGMVIDFGTIGETVQRTIVTTYDHRFAVCEDDPRLHGLRFTFDPEDLVIVSDPPTAENLARWIGHDLAISLSPARVTRVRLWETPNCSAMWSPP